MNVFLCNAGRHLSTATRNRVRTGQVQLWNGNAMAGLGALLENDKRTIAWEIARARTIQPPLGIEPMTFSSQD